MRIFALILSASLLCGHAMAQTGNPTSSTTVTEGLQLNTITTAVPFLMIAPDARASAMGDVGGITSPDANAIYWNTSKLSFAEEKLGISFNYSPWLRRLGLNDVHLAYLSGYSKLDKKGRHVLGGSLRYFTLGEIAFTSNTGSSLGNFKPNEFAITAGYALKLHDFFSIGLNGKFIYSDLTNGMTVGGQDSKAGKSGAADVSFSYYQPDIRMGSKKATVGAAFVLSNIGSKMAYNTTADRDFLPTNLRLSGSFKVDLDKYNSLTFATDVNKLLVPTPSYTVTDSSGNETLIGYNTDVGVAKGMFQSFYDAPGNVILDEQSGEVLGIEKGSRIKEELSEITVGLGMEYWYSNLVAVRGGYFFEAQNKGARQYITMGFGIQYSMIGLDFSYLMALKRDNPLANTLRFGLNFKLNRKKAEQPAMEDQAN